MLVVIFNGVENYKAWNSAGIILIGISVVMNIHKPSIVYTRVTALMALIGTFITGFAALYS
jgi:hypothetical protein|tara:strand:- start:4046 stop:4228 length:183 start_codon:yes stop_codon:yes gene_type:complete